jgi:hypothetical protein
MAKATLPALTKYDPSLNESMNAGLVLKKDQGFQFLSDTEKAFLVLYLFDVKHKAKAYARSFFGTDYDELSQEDKNTATLKANVTWKKIENTMGGVRNIIALMGIDVVKISREALRLMHVKKMVLDKDGEEHYMDDGSVQMKAVEFLAKLSGNYTEELENANKTSININFGTLPPANPEDIMSDNMEVVIGRSEKVEEDGV